MQFDMPKCIRLLNQEWREGEGGKGRAGREGREGKGGKGRAGREGGGREGKGGGILPNFERPL